MVIYLVLLALVVILSLTVACITGQSVKGRELDRLNIRVYDLEGRIRSLEQQEQREQEEHRAWRDNIDEGISNILSYTGARQEERDEYGS